MKVDRDRIQELGVQPEAILGTVASGLQGRELTRFEEAGREIRLIAQYDASIKPDLLDLKDTRIWTRGRAFQRLDDLGNIGIRTINTDNIVEFYLVEILADAPDGVWVTGLPNRAAVITVGQELVTAGERVDPIFQGNTMPARTTPTPPKSSALPYTANIGAAQP